MDLCIYGFMHFHFLMVENASYFKGIEGKENEEEDEEGGLYCTVKVITYSHSKSTFNFRVCLNGALYVLYTLYLPLHGISSYRQVQLRL